jgi:PmbA protein
MTFEEAKTYLLERAKKQTVEAEVLAEETRELSLKAFEGKLEDITSAVKGGIGVRVEVNGKIGYASSEERSQEALDWVLQEAIENATLQTTSDGFIPTGTAQGRHDLVDEGLSGDLEQKRAMPLEMEKLIRGDKRTDQVNSTQYSEFDSEILVASTKGSSGGYRTGAAYVGGNVIMTDGTIKKSGWEYKAKREVNKLEPGQTALELVEKTARHLGAKPLKTGKYRAYFEPKAFIGLLSVFGEMLSAQNVLEGQSKLANRLGDKIGSDLVTLVDDPMHPEGLGSQPFDAEGTKSQRLVLIDKGVLKSYIHNSYTAKKLGMTNTAHASRTYNTPLNVDFSNLFLEPGAGITLKDGIIVTNLSGLHAGANPISGEFSVQALGIKVEGGESVHAVENFAIAGEWLELLQNIVGLGDRLEWQSSLASPLVEVAELSFAGA